MSLSSMCVLEKDKKSKFLHFNLQGVPVFTYPEELKQFMLDNYPNVLYPVRNTNFRLGYFIDGSGNKKFGIVDQPHLNLRTGRLSLCVDSHYQ